MRKARGRSNGAKKVPHGGTRWTAPRGEATAHRKTGHNLLRKALTQPAIHDALYDPHTNLYNPEYFDYRIKTEITRADRNKHSLGILLCELDPLRVINETRGPQAVDEAVKAVAEAIREATRETDLAFRWGGNEILVILSDTSTDGLLIASDRIRRYIHEINRPTQLALDVKMGAALYPEHGSKPDELLRVAKRALSIAKNGADRIHIGEEDYHVDERSIKVVFQPIVDVRLNQLLGYEALSRDSQGGLTIPDLFKQHLLVGYEAFSRDPQDKLSVLDLFKRYQAIGQLHELKCICFGSQLNAAQEAGVKTVFINVDFNMLSKIVPAPKPSDMEVILEISELEALHDVENHLKIAGKWQDGGFKFAIDDFGAGYVSLPFIAQLTPAYIKLDRSTLLQAVSSEKFRRFLKDLLLTLKNYVTAGFIAEGVETEQELQTVKDIGISYVQGFFLGRPEELK